MRADARIVELVALSSMPPARIVPFLYPRMFRVDNLGSWHGVPVPQPQPGAGGGVATAAADEAEAPQPRDPTTLTVEDLRLVALPPVVYPSFDVVAANPQAVYLVDHRGGLVLFVGAQADPEALTQLFGAGAGGELMTPEALAPGAQLGMFDSAASMRLWAVVLALRARRAVGFVPLSIVGPADKEGGEALRALMVEDTGKFGAKSYVDLLCHVHTEIQRRLTPA